MRNRIFPVYFPGPTVLLYELPFRLLFFRKLMKRISLTDPFCQLPACRLIQPPAPALPAFLPQQIPFLQPLLPVPLCQLPACRLIQPPAPALPAFLPQQIPFLQPLLPVALCQLPASLPQRLFLLLKE